MATYPGAEDGHVRGDLATGSWTSLRKPMALDNTCAGYFFARRPDHGSRCWLRPGVRRAFACPKTMTTMPAIKGAQGARETAASYSIDRLGGRTG